MHTSSSVILIDLILICGYKALAVTGGNSFYTAGVVEFKPAVGLTNSTEMLADHLKSYLSIVESVEAADTDIIVFPEGTLNNELHLTHVPSEKLEMIPCLENEGNIFADFFVQLSCAARRLGKYLVINLTEKENCPVDVEDPRPCANNNLNIYNTNVVFDREGRVISRYRKVHIYVENKNTTYEPEFAIFSTDFGVSFGHFICFDILFYTPAQELVDRFNVTDFIFASYFYSELPFLTALQLQHGWAWAKNVNLLAAGASYPEWGMTGSGIYAGNLGALVAVMESEKGVRKLYKARVPIKPTKFVTETEIAAIITKPDSQSTKSTKLRLLKDPNIANYTSVLLDIEPTETKWQRQLCAGEICCNFEVIASIVNASQAFNFKYRVGIFDGRRTYEKNEWSDIKVCALYVCSNEEPSSCGEPVTTANVIFKTIDIKGHFPKVNKVMIMPSLLDDQFYPLKHTDVLWSKKQLNFSHHNYEVNLSLSRAQANIMTFGIYAQYYEKSNAAATTKPTSIFSFTFVFAFILSSPRLFAFKT